MYGSKMLKTISVLWMIFGVVSLAAAGGELVSLLTMKLAVSTFWTPVVLALIWAAAQIAAGFLGLKNWAKPEKAKLCMMAAGITVLTCLAYNVCMILYGQLVWSIMSIIAGLAVAALYLLGARYNHQLNA